VYGKACLVARHRREGPPTTRSPPPPTALPLTAFAAPSFLAPRLTALRHKLAVIPAGVDLGEFSPNGDRLSARRKVGLADAPTVFFLARLDRTHYFKGLHLLIDAIARLPEARLVVGGDG